MKNTLNNRTGFQSNVGWFSLGASLLVVGLSACGGGEEPKTPEPPMTAEPAPAPAPAPMQTEKDDDGSGGNINISPDILKACGISNAEAHFAYDSARIQQGSAPVLDKLAQCFSSGNLAGRTMRLVGHADPRGDEEYNMVLGGRRSDSVKTYLVRAGLKDEQAESTSRGEMEATGTDEAGWAKDRRVDIVLAD